MSKQLTIAPCEKGKNASGYKRDEWYIKSLWYKCDLSFELVLPYTVCFNAPLVKFGHTWKVLDRKQQELVEVMLQLMPSGLISVELSSRRVRFEVRRRANDHQAVIDEVVRIFDKVYAATAICAEAAA